MKKLGILLLAIAAAFCSSCSNSSDTNVVVIEQSADSKKKTFPVKVVTFKEAIDVGIYGQEGASLPLFFIEGKEDIPYFVINDKSLKDTIVEDESKDWRSYKVSSVSASSKTVSIVNEKTASTATFDLVHHTLSFDNYDAFFQNSVVYFNAAGALSDYMKFLNYSASSGTTIPGYSNVAGQPITLDWSTQDIGVVLAKVDGKYYLAMPLQSYTDIFNAYLVYNGQCFFYSPNLANFPSTDPYCLAYYSTATIHQGQRSQALAEYCYNELCINLGFNYGLKAMHGIEAFPDFDHYFEAAGVKGDLLSTDPLKFATALRDVCEFYFGDGHSNYMRNSPYLGKDTVVPIRHIGSAQQNQIHNHQRYYEARNARFGAGTIPAYEVTSDGKTAIVRFDSFVPPKKNNAQSYASARDALLNDTTGILDKYVGNLENDYDTISMISAVNERIQNTAGIENVVLDLSCNGGGANHTACFVISWMLGTCQYDFRNPITGAKCSALYCADVDFDGDYESERNSVCKKKLFCIVSPVSFSCGNMVPAVLKDSTRVTILGTPSSGGTSCVQFSSVADGTIIRFSSKNVMSVVKNGSYYDIDKGVEPHYYINSPANFYNKEEIAAIVNDINSKR